MNSTRKLSQKKIRNEMAPQTNQMKLNSIHEYTTTAEMAPKTNQMKLNSIHGYTTTAEMAPKLTK